MKRRDEIETSSEGEELSGVELIHPVKRKTEIKTVSSSGYQTPSTSYNVEGSKIRKRIKLFHSYCKRPIKGFKKYSELKSESLKK